MNESITVSCPYCGEPLVIEPEPSDEMIEYIEDCHVCCRPILVTVNYAEHGSEVLARREDE